MRLTRQREAMDCGLAVVAMITGVNYLQAREVALRLKAWTPTVGMPTPGLRASLAALGFASGEKLLRLPHRNPRWAPPHSVIKIPGVERIGHWVAWDGERVFDPAAPGPMPVTLWFNWRGRRVKRPSSFLETWRHAEHET